MLGYSSMAVSGFETINFEKKCCKKDKDVVNKITFGQIYGSHVVRPMVGEDGGDVERKQFLLAEGPSHLAQTKSFKKP